MKTLIIIPIALISFLIQAQQSNDLFKDANRDYNKGQYEEAIQHYLKILENGQHSAALYYNLGNTYYKLNEIAASIYNYEKALQLAPDDPDIKNNLTYAQQMTIDAIEVVPSTGVFRVVENSIKKYTYDTWAILCIVLMLFFMIGFLCYYFSSNQHRKRVFFMLSMLALLMAILSFLAVYNHYNSSKRDRPAIIFEKEISITAEPNERSEVVFLLHEGTKVNVQDELGEWKKIRLTDGKTGWIPSESIKEIKDF